MSECGMDKYPHGLVYLAVPFLWGLLEEIEPSILYSKSLDWSGSTDSPVNKIRTEDMVATESKLFWMLYMLCQEHNVRGVLENPSMVLSHIDNIIEARDEELYKFLKEKGLSVTS